MKASRKLMRLALLPLGLMLALVTAPSALADSNGPPHMRDAGTILTGTATAAVLTTDKCASCHRVHIAAEPLLLKEEVKDICYGCHGGGSLGSSEDVQAGTSSAGGANIALRGGGFDFALINASNPSFSPGAGFETQTSQVRGVAPFFPAIPPVVPPLAVGQPTTSAHSIDGSQQTAWGASADVELTPANLSVPANKTFGGASTTYGTKLALECTSCHDPHGTGTYRLLKAKPNYQGDPLATPIVASLSPTHSVTIPDVGPFVADAVKDYTTDNYWKAGAPTQWQPANPVMAGSPSNTDFLQSSSLWCTQCHSRYLAYRDQTAAGSRPYKYASGDPVFKYRHSSERRLIAPWVAGGAEPAAYASTKPYFCINCHVAHGSNAVQSTAAGDESSSQVAFPDGTVSAGDSKLLRISNRGVCRVCHNVGLLWS